MADALASLVRKTICLVFRLVTGLQFDLVPLYTPAPLLFVNVYEAHEFEDAAMKGRLGATIVDKATRRQGICLKFAWIIVSVVLFGCGNKVSENLPAPLVERVQNAAPDL